MRINLLTFILISVMLSAPALLAGDAARLYVVNTLSENITVIDTANDTVTGAIPLPARGYNLDVSPDNRLLYVTSTIGDDKSSNIQESAQLLSCDLSTLRMVRSLSVPMSPLANVHVLPDGKQAVVVTAAAPGMRNTERGKVLYVDLAGGKITRTLPIGLNPLASAITPDGKKLYSADWASRAISVVDVEKGSLLDTIPLGQYTTRLLAMRADGAKVYAALEPLPVTVNAQALNTTNNLNNRAQTQAANLVPPTTDDLLWEIDTRQDIIARYPLGGLNPVHALAVSPDGTRVYVYGRITLPESQQYRSSVSPYQLMVIDIKTKRITQQWNGYGYLSNMVISPDGNRLYLIGTPGDPQREQQAQASFNKVVQTEQAANSGRSINTSVVRDNLLTNVGQIDKTITVIDARTGKYLKRFTAGSLPQGAIIVE